jgi:hypothetical protein
MMIPRSDMDNRDRHVYWFKSWRWWRGSKYQYPSGMTSYENVTVLDMNGYTYPARRECSTMFIAWNKPKTLFDFLLGAGLYRKSAREHR